MKKLRLILIVILISAVSLFLFKSHFDKKNKEAEVSAIRAVVEKYIQADLAGANLGTDNFVESGLEKILVPGEEAAPGWDTVSLVKSYKLKSIENKKVKGKDLAIASVAYEIIGEVPGAVEVVRLKETENYVFRLVKEDKTWKLIQPFDLRPHVTIETTIKHLKTLVGHEGQGKVPEVIQQLEKMKGNV